MTRRRLRGTGAMACSCRLFHHAPACEDAFQLLIHVVDLSGEPSEARARARAMNGHSHQLQQSRHREVALKKPSSERL